MASPLLGYNNNFRHKNRTFHVQTEDSGVKHPHVITHLFADGGRIVKSVKTTYAEYVGNAKMTDIVREMMKQQHKAMIIALRDGQLDHLLDLPPGKKTSKAAPAAEPAAEAKASETAGTPAPAGEEAPDTARTPHEQGLTLDIEALERAAAAAEGDGTAIARPSDLPPPPENLFREKSATGGYRSVAPPPPASDTERPPVRRPRSQVPPPQDARREGSAPASRPPPPKDGPARDGRYGAARPAAIFGGKSKSQAAPKAIFGEDLISDKSLDEVILSYLAEDLEPSGDKR